MSAPLVTVCIPTYQRPKLLEEAVRSCIAQTMGNFEVVITDNSLDDASTQMMRQFGSDPRIRYFKNDGNIGPHGSCLRAMSLARGKYIKWLMDDDLMKPQFLELTVAPMERHPNVGITMAPMELIDADGKRIYPKFYGFRTMRLRYRYQVGDGLIERNEILKDFLVRDYPCCVPSGTIFRHEFFQKHGFNDPATDFAGDLDLTMRTALHYDFYYVDQVLSAWRYFALNHTATLHQKGLPVHVFYYITRKILNDPQARQILKAENWDRLVRDAYYFCACRSLLNVHAGLRGRNLRLVWDTVKLIFREDPHKINPLRLPYFVAREIWASLFPANWPPPRGDE